MCNFIGLLTGMFYGPVFIKCIAELYLWKYNMNLIYMDFELCVQMNNS